MYPIFKNRLFLFIIFLLLFASVLIFLYSQKNLTSSDIKSGYFTLVESEKDLVWRKDLQDLNVMEDAVIFYQQQIKDLEKQVIGIQDEQEKKNKYDDLALYYSKLGDYRTSYQYYIKSLDVSFVNRKTWLNFGNLLVKMNAYKSAELAYLKANEINPYEELNYVELADLYILMGKKEGEILEVYDKGIELIEKPSILLRGKAEFYEERNLYQEAIYVYQRLLTISDNAEAIQNKIDKLKLKL
jgi:tetratricopeptide (TPR) repeat protein